MLKRRARPPSTRFSAKPKLKAMPSSRAREKSGIVAAFGISVSKKASTSAWSAMNQRGKKVVSASSG